MCPGQKVTVSHHFAFIIARPIKIQRIGMSAIEHRHTTPMTSQTYIFHLLSTQKYNLINNSRKGVPELRGPALACMSAIDKKSA